MILHDLEQHSLLVTELLLLLDIRLHSLDFDWLLLLWLALLGHQISRHGYFFDLDFRL